MTSSQFKKRFPVGTKFDLTYHWRDARFCGPRQVYWVGKAENWHQVQFQDPGGFLTLENVEFTETGFVAKLLIKGKMENGLVYELSPAP